MHLRISKLVVVISFIAVTLLATLHTAEATIIYSTFGEPGQTYTADSGWGLGSGGGIAIPFTTDATYRLDALDFAAFAFAGPSPITVSLIEGSLQSGKTLETFEIFLPTSPWVPQLFQAQSILHPLLNAGAQFWFVTSADERLKSLIYLDFNNRNISGSMYYRYNDEWNPLVGHLPAVGVYGTQESGTPVPEPSSLILLFVGLVSVVYLRSRNAGLS